MDGGGEIAEGTLRPFVQAASADAGTEGILAADFDGIVVANQRRVFSVLYSLVRDRDTADTLTQECFLRAYQKRHSFRGEASVATWLVSIATNLARDYGRNQRMAFWRKLWARNPGECAERQSFQIADPAPSPERVLLAREQVESVWAAMEELPPRQRTAFALRFAGEMTLAEIANVMDLEVGTVKAQLFRAINAIRKAVQRQAQS